MYTDQQLYGVQDLVQLDSNYWGVKDPESGNVLGRGFRTGWMGDPDPNQQYYLETNEAGATSMVPYFGDLQHGVYNDPILNRRALEWSNGPDAWTNAIQPYIDSAKAGTLGEYAQFGNPLTNPEQFYRNAQLSGNRTAIEQSRISQNKRTDLTEGILMTVLGAGMGSIAAGAGALSGAGSSYLGAARGVGGALMNDNPVGLATSLAGAGGWDLSSLVGGGGDWLRNVLTNGGGITGVGGIDDGSWGVNAINSGGGMDDWMDWTSDQTAMGDWAGLSDFDNSFPVDYGLAGGLDVDVPGAGTGPGGMTGPDLSGGGGGIMDTIGNILKTGGSAAAGLISRLIAPTSEGGLGLGGAGLSALLGAIIGGTSGKAADIRTETTPWNASYWSAPQNAATALMGNNPLNQPAIPTLPGLPDLANEEHLNAAIQAALRPVRQNFYDPGGTASQIRSEFGDQYGSSRNQLALGVASGRLAQTEADTAARMTNDLYRTNLAYNQDRAQQDILNTQWGFGQQTSQADKAFQAPWQNILNASNVFGAAAGRGSTTVQPMPNTPWWQTAAGGALQGLELYDKIFRKPA